MSGRTFEHMPNASVERNPLGRIRVTIGNMYLNLDVEEAARCGGHGPEHGCALCEAKARQRAYHFRAVWLAGRNGESDPVEIEPDPHPDLFVPEDRR